MLPCSLASDCDFLKELKDDDARHDEGRRLTLACYDMLPATRITDVLSQVERWTGFTRHFGHVSTGLPPGDEQAFLATLIAEATNLGLSRMAEVCGAGSRARCCACRHGTCARKPFGRRSPV
jgi:hypothetical protein